MNRRDVLKAASAVIAAELLTKGAGAINLTTLFPQCAMGLARPKAIVPGPFQPKWESLRDNYRSPAWFNEAKLGIFLHWGLYAVPAYHNEWYAKHMYTGAVEWHTQHYGAPDKFGYKDFIPLFKAESYDPSQWAALFKAAGAHYVVPVAEHHDGFAMWDSNLTRWCAGKMGPKRDLIGDLAKAVRDEGLIFGLSNHRMEHHTFMYPAAGVKNDQFDPEYADFYGPPVPGSMNDGNASREFQEDWLARCQELIDKYEPQFIYFDNGVNDRAYDEVKLRMAAYYYNSAARWKKESTIAAKDVAFLAGAVQDFEKSVRAPKWVLPGSWQVDDSISSNTWGYTNDIRYRSAASIIQELVDVASKGGNLMLNVAPKADGTIPEEQQRILKTVGKWLEANGEGIYGAKPWTAFGEGPSVPSQLPPEWHGGSSAKPSEMQSQRTPPPTEEDFRFTTRRGSLYAYGLVWPRQGVVLKSLGSSTAIVKRVTLMESNAALPFRQTENGLEVQLPAPPPQGGPYGLRIEGTRVLGQM